jgi:hypothetical protein
LATTTPTADTSYEENAQGGSLNPAKGESEEERVRRYALELKRMTDDLRPYWTQMGKNEELYEFYKSEYTETAVNVALNTPFAIIESQIAKENTASLIVTVKAEGENNLAEFEKWVASSVKHIIEDRRVAMVKGTFRKKKERFSRQLKVVGNAIAEVSYCYATQVEGGKTVTTADNPYLINRHYKQVIFNPAKTLDSSDVYYVIDHMKLSDMRDQEYYQKKDKDGRTVTGGRFRNLDQLAKAKKSASILSDDTDIRFSSGDTKISKKNEPIQVVTRWEQKKAGWTRCVFAAGRVMVMPDEVDPYRIGCHNLLIGMRYVVEGRPYAYGEMDPIYKLARAQDTIVNQKIEIINKYLRGSYIAGPSLDVDSLMLILAQGGVMNGIASDLQAVPVNPVPQGAFQETAELQQALERAARYSPYSTGTPVSSDDRTKGTKGGIIALQNASEPNAESQVDDIEDMLLEPYAYMALKMKARYMSPDETFHALIDGKTPEWVKVTKGILSGNATLQDFITAGIITPEQSQSIVGTPHAKTGEPISRSTVLFSVDWMVSVSLDAQSAQEKQSQISAEQALIDFSIEKLGAQFDAGRVVEYLADKNDASEIKALLMTPQEKQAASAQQQQAASQAAQQHVQVETAIAQAKQTPAPERTQERLTIMTNYKDAPPDVQRQIEALDGLTPSRIQPQVAATMKRPLPDFMQDAPPQPALAQAPQ